MVDRRKDAEVIQLSSPAKTHASNGRHIHSGKRKFNLDEYSAGEDVQFDEIYPVFIPASERTTEEIFNSTEDIDDFVAALPVKEMYALHVAICQGEEDKAHNFLWMLRWLRTCMELSEITRPHLRARMRFWKDHLDRLGRKLDTEIEKYLEIASNPGISETTVDHRFVTGMWREERYNKYASHFWALDKLDKLMNELNRVPAGHECPCKKCLYYRSPEWAASRPIDLEPKALKPKTFDMIWWGPYYAAYLAGQTA